MSVWNLVTLAKKKVERRKNNQTNQQNHLADLGH